MKFLTILATMLFCQNLFAHSFDINGEQGQHESSTSSSIETTENTTLEQDAINEFDSINELISNFNQQSKWKSSIFAGYTETNMISRLKYVSKDSGFNLF